MTRTGHRLALALLAVGLTRALAAQPSAIEAGFGGVARPGCLVPVHVTATQGTRPCVQPDSSRLSCEAARSDRDDCWLYLPWPAQNHTKSFDLCLSQGTVVRTASVFETNAALVAWVPAEHTGLYRAVERHLESDDSNVLAMLRKPDQSRVQLSAVHYLPDSAAGYEALSSVVLEATPANWSEAVSTALSAWVRRGGNLVVVGAVETPLDCCAVSMIDSPAWAGEERDRQALAAAYHRDLAEYAPRRRPAADLRGGSTVLVGTARRPLVAERALGRGRVCWLAAPWTGAQLWLDALAPVRPWDGRLTVGEFEWTDASTDWRLLQRCSLGAPVGWVVLALPLGYLLALGLLHRAWRRRRRPAVAWLAAPLLAAGCVAGAVAVTGAYRGHSGLAQTFTQVVVGPGERLGTARSRTVVLARRACTADIQLPPQAAPAPLDRYLTPSERSLVERDTPARWRVGPGGQLTLRDVRLSHWSTPRLDYEYPCDLGGTLEVRAWPNHNGHADLRVVSHLDVPLLGVTQSCGIDLSQWTGYLSRQADGAWATPHVVPGRTGGVLLTGLPPLARGQASYDNPLVLLLTVWAERRDCPLGLDLGAGARRRQMLRIEVPCSLRPLLPAGTALPLHETELGRDGDHELRWCALPDRTQATPELVRLPRGPGESDNSDEELWNVAEQRWQPLDAVSADCVAGRGGVLLRRRPGHYRSWPALAQRLEP